MRCVGRSGVADDININININMYAPGLAAARAEDNETSMEWRAPPAARARAAARRSTLAA
eukprot:SAG31_NODE_38124_length_298_cov_2.311558_1_plen_59_part_10